MRIRIYLGLYILFTLFTLSGHSRAGALPQYAVRAYGPKDGLGHGFMHDIIQDREGVMWFATWNGLSCFDGYTFRNFKAGADGTHPFTSGRVLSITEDSVGCLWLVCYDNSVYRFDPRDERVLPVPLTGGRRTAQTAVVRPLVGGVVWVLGNGTAVRASYDADSQQLALRPPVNLASCGELTDVHRDDRGQEWILSSRGLFRFDPLTEMLRPVRLPGAPETALRTLMEDGRRLLVAGDSGRVVVCDKATHRLTLHRLPTRAAVTDIARCADGSLLFSTDGDGLFLATPSDTLHFSTRTPGGPADNHIYKVYTDRHGLAWLEYASLGIGLFDPSHRRFTHFLMRDEHGRPLATETGVLLAEDANGILWVHPKGGGLAWYDRPSNTLVPFNPAQRTHEWRSNDRCFSICTDRQGNLWMSTLLGGLTKITFQHAFFHLLPLDADDPESPGNEVRALLVDRQGRTWAGTRNNELLVLDPYKHLLGRLDPSAGRIVTRESAATRFARVYAVMQDRDGDIWVSTKGQGIYRLRPSGEGRFRTEHYTHSSVDPYSLSCDEVYHLFEDSRGRVWVATYGGGLNLVRFQADGSLRFLHARNELKSFPLSHYYKLRHVSEDSHGRIWVSSTVGALACDGRFSRPSDIRWTRCLDHCDVHMVDCLPGGEVFAATFGRGLQELTSFGGGKASFRAYTHADGLIADIIYAIRPDDRGNLWLATEKGLIKYRPADGTFEHYENDFTAFNIQFSEGAGTFAGTQIQLGTTKGIFYFNPAEVFKNTFTPTIRLSALVTDHRTVSPGDSTGILRHTLNHTSLVCIPHGIHTVGIRYAALDMSNTEDIQYAYRLDGFDREYRYVGESREATYTNLPPGHYTFRVKSTNSEGVWRDNEKTLAVEVLPSFWQTPWAWLLYTAGVVGLFVLVLRLYRAFYRLKDKAEREELMAQFKLKFFTDVSHELRTPLTLISGPLEYMLARSPLTDDVRGRLLTVKHNSDRLLRLVNQILDFNKLQDNRLKLYVRRLDLSSLLERTVADFRLLAEKRDIRLSYGHPSGDVWVWCDAEKMEQVVGNLLSNAFKYTPEHRAIRVELTTDGGAAVIRVTDEGVGISPQKLRTIFGRFETSPGPDFTDIPGTGIGLALTKELVELHGGTIGVRSRPGEGSCFTVTLPPGRDHFPADTEFLLTDAAAPSVPTSVPACPQPAAPESGEETASSSMLIVEDNDELRRFIAEVFSPDFRVVEARDGEEGLASARTLMPDIILTDIMMPRRDGLSLLRELRADIGTSHIPVVLLTAKADSDNRLRGLETGADAYIVKPFGISYLRAQVDNLLERRKRLQAYYGNPQRTPVPDEPEADRPSDTLTAGDREFLEKLDALIDRELDNPDLSVEQLVEHFSFGRTVFFRKLKALTGKSPILYIKEARMTRAARLLKERRNSIAEIAYAVGFSDPHYFSKSFKQYYGVSPTDYAGDPD